MQVASTSIVVFGVVSSESDDLLKDSKLLSCGEDNLSQIFA